MISQIRSIFLQNWMSKLACLAIAFTVWFWVNIQQTGEKTFEVPINFNKGTEDIVVTKQSNRNVNITLRGPQSSLLGTDPSDITVELDLNKQTAGTHTIWSRELSIEHPESLEITNIQPRSIRVVLAQRSSKTVPVKPMISRDPPTNYVYDLNLIPDTAAIEGPTTVLDELSSIQLRSQDLSDKTENFTVTDIKANLPQNVTLLQPPENSFSLEVRISQKQVKKTVNEIPVNVKNVPSGMIATVEPQKLSLTIRGPKGSVENVTSDEIRVAVKAPAEESKMVIRAASINLPNGLEIVNNDQQIPAFKVRLESR